MAMTVTQFQDAVDRVLSERSLRAQNSAYDRSTCVSAVSAARQTVLAVDQRGDVAAYHRQIVNALRRLHDDFSDPDGEFTSGRGVIGDVLQDILAINPNS